MTIIDLSPSEQAKALGRPASSPGPTPEMLELLDRQRAAYRRDGVADARTRVDRLTRLQALIVDNAEELAAAMTADFGSRPRHLSYLSDIMGALSDLDYQKKHVRSWMKPRRPGGLASRLLSPGEIRPTPKGVVGIMGPWNFPLYLVMAPAGAALAAGNRVMLRPSEITARTTAVLAARVHDYFSPEEFTVLTEAQGEGASFARLKVDHMFFTGSPQVGALVAAAAAENLVPVTLELGGKNPVVLDASADLAQAAERIADSRMINGGQVCLCPDYVFVPADRLDKFTTMVVDRWRSRNPQIIANKDFVSLVNDKNFDRVVGLIDDAVARGARKHEAAPDGEVLPDRATRKIAPTLLTGVRGDMRISQEEVFGPVLSVYPYTNLRQVTDHINEHEHPLTMYWFGDHNSRFEQLAAETRTGSISANDFAVIFNNKNLPFGGIGQSGSGQYHGPFGFETFSHQRAVAFSRAPFSGAAVAVGPYTKLESRLIKFQMRAMHRAVRKVTRRSASEGVSSEGRA